MFIIDAANDAVDQCAEVVVLLVVLCCVVL